jgi:hypothetical protein
MAPLADPFQMLACAHIDVHLHQLPFPDYAREAQSLACREQGWKRQMASLQRQRATAEKRMEACRATHQVLLQQVDPQLAESSLSHFDSLISFHGQK